MTKVLLVDDLYEVSNFGEIRNRKTGKCLTPRQQGKSFYIKTRFNLIPLHFIVSLHFNKHEIHQNSAINLLENSNKSKHLKPATRGERQSHMMRKSWAKRNKRKGKVLVGVYKFNRTTSKKKWRSAIKINGVYKTIGYFNFRKDAKLAYDKFVKENYKVYYSGVSK